MCAYISSLNLQAMPGVEGEMVVDEDKLGKLDNEPSGWKGVGKVLLKELFQGKETMGVREVTSKVTMMELGGRSMQRD